MVTSIGNYALARFVETNQHGAHLEIFQPGDWETTEAPRQVNLFGLAAVAELRKFCDDILSKFPEANTKP